MNENNVMKFEFDIQKAIAATGYICKLNGGSFDILKTINAIFLAEQKMIFELRQYITGDKIFYFCNDIITGDKTVYFYCPNEEDPITREEDPITREEDRIIVSRIYDLMRGIECGQEDMELWSSVFHPIENNTISLKDKVDMDSLCEEEKLALRDGYDTVKNLSQNEVLKFLYTHELFPEIIIKRLEESEVIKSEYEAIVLNMNEELNHTEKKCVSDCESCQ